MRTTYDLGSMKSVWMVRSGRGGENVDEFLRHGVVAVGFTSLNLRDLGADKDAIMKAAIANAPEEKPAAVASWVSQLMRLKNEVKIGDTAITFDREARVYYVGEIAGEHEWNDKVLVGMPHIRRVRWKNKVLRDSLGAATRNTCGSSLTLFKLNEDAAADFAAHEIPISSSTLSTGESSEELPAESKAEQQAVVDDTVERADEFVEDAINRLSWSDVQELVAGVLRGMGYRTKVSPHGSDRGVDIFASPDGLGLQEPRIFVEVKHRTAPTSADLIRSFLGGRRSGDRCLYVSTGSFTKDARYEAERASVPITLIDLQELRRLSGRELREAGYADARARAASATLLARSLTPLDRRTCRTNRLAREHAKSADNVLVLDRRSIDKSSRSNSQAPVPPGHAVAAP